MEYVSKNYLSKEDPKRITPYIPDSVTEEMEKMLQGIKKTEV